MFPFEGVADNRIVRVCGAQHPVENTSVALNRPGALILSATLSKPFLGPLIVENENVTVRQYDVFKKSSSDGCETDYLYHSIGSLDR